ncbi:MAG: DinB family protein [Planctomycetes bacterium]|nr:DinB family protein [Planctomycetota bacterium]
MRNSNHQYWNDQFKKLRELITNQEMYQEALDLFLELHGAVHSSRVSESGLWSFADEVLGDLTEEQYRGIPEKSDFSIVWRLWHMARIEDITLNLLVAGKDQVFNQGRWVDKLKATVIDTGNSMDRQSVRTFSQQIVIPALQDYRAAVGEQTRQLAKEMKPQELKRKVRQEDLQRIRQEGAVLGASAGLLEYWGKKTVAGLFLMPATRHNFVHLNEVLRIKKSWPKSNQASCW